MRLISQTRKALSKLSSAFRGRPKSLRSCCSTSVIAVTLSNRMQRIRNSVCNFTRFSDRRNLNVCCLGKRILKNTSSEGDKKVEDFRTTLLELHKSFLDEAVITTEITALQILDDAGIISAKVGIISLDVGVISADVGRISANVGIISANVGKISSHLDGMATQLKWVSSQVSDVGTYYRYLERHCSENYHRAGRKNQRDTIRDRLEIHTRQGLSHGNTHSFPGLHYQLGE